MRYGMTFSQGDIVSVPASFSDGTGVKPRPVVIISNSQINDRYFDVIYCNVSTKKKNLPHEVVLT